MKRVMTVFCHLLVIQKKIMAQRRNHFLLEGTISLKMTIIMPKIGGITKIQSMTIKIQDHSFLIIETLSRILEVEIMEEIHQMFNNKKEQIELNHLLLMEEMEEILIRVNRILHLC